jgi:glycosyltransferase involved in cell wall biosynthesis
VGDPEKLARAIGEALERPGDPRAGLQRARAFDIQNIADQYLQLLSCGREKCRRHCAP